jgi:hypothetical protein
MYEVCVVFVTFFFLHSYNSTVILIHKFSLEFDAFTLKVTGVNSEKWCSVDVLPLVTDSFMDVLIRIAAIKAIMKLDVS